MDERLSMRVDLIAVYTTLLITKSDPHGQARHRGLSIRSKQEDLQTSDYLICH